MEDWNQGYVTEIPYTYGFYPDLSPSFLEYAVLCKGFAPPSLEKFTYCELGCGQGLTTNLLAAANPNGEFFATDFNPSQIIEANTLAEAAGTPNVHFFDQSFQDFIHEDLPELDFICLHGIYSWISRENQQAIVDFIQKKLKVGGCVYISYNSLPGWSSLTPLQDLLFRFAAQASGPIQQKLDGAIDFANQLQEAEATYFKNNPVAQYQLKTLKDQNRTYLAHEYLNSHWNPLYFSDIAEDLSRAKLTFINSTDIIKQINSLQLTPAAQEILKQIHEPIWQQVVRDIFINTRFRRDIFGKGTLRLSALEHTERLLNMRFALMIFPTSVELSREFPTGKITIQPDIAQPIVDLLAEGPKTLNQLCQDPKLHKFGVTNLHQVMMTLIGLHYIQPTLPAEVQEQCKQSTERFNAAVEERAKFSDQIAFLASPVTGSGVRATNSDQLFLSAKAKGIDPTEYVWQVLCASGQRMSKDGKVLTTEKESLAELGEQWQTFRDKRLPVLKQLGIC